MLLSAGHSQDPTHSNLFRQCQMSIRGTHVPFEPIFIFQRFNKKHLLKSFSPRSHVDKRNPLFPLNRYFIFKHLDGKTLPKAQRTQGLSSYHRISIKNQLQKLNQTSASRHASSSGSEHCFVDFSCQTDSPVPF